MIDVLDYMLTPASFQREQHMQSADGSKYNAGLWLPGWIWQIKSAKGFPWDGNFYDESYVYQNITEGPQGWTDPTSYKAFASKSWLGGHGGIAWSPRYITSDEPPPFLVTADTTYNTYDQGKLISTQNLGGPAQCQIDGPFVGQTVGALTNLSTLVQTYQWGPGLANMEVNTYALGYGWVQWALYTLQGGVYVLTSSISTHDTIATPGTPSLVFPNPLP